MKLHSIFRQYTYLLTYLSQIQFFTHNFSELMLASMWRKKYAISQCKQLIKAVRA